MMKLIVSSVLGDYPSLKTERICHILMQSSKKQLDGTRWSRWVRHSYIKSHTPVLIKIPLWSGVARRTLADDWYKGFHIPKGTIIVPNLWYYFIVDQISLKILRAFFQGSCLFRKRSIWSPGLHPGKISRWRFLRNQPSNVAVRIRAQVKLFKFLNELAPAFSRSGEQ